MHTLFVQAVFAWQSLASQQALSGMQALPHFLCVLAHLKSQRWPSQLAVAFVGTAHGAHALAPQPFTLVLAMHTPEQLCVPSGHLPVQAASAAMHVPAQACWPAGQLGLHWVPSQDALPPLGAAHASHDWPQLSGALFETQASPQTCVPAGHAHCLSLHRALFGQSASLQHAPSETQASPQRLAPAGQLHS
jgi:hypothetical protein